VQFALYTYAQNVVRGFVAPKNSYKANAVPYLKQWSA
jgi:hypothetical protein